MKRSSEERMKAAKEGRKVELTGSEMLFVILAMLAVLGLLAMLVIAIKGLVVWVAAYAIGLLGIPNTVVAGLLGAMSARSAIYAVADSVKAIFATGAPMRLKMMVANNTGKSLLLQSLIAVAALHAAGIAIAPAAIGATAYIVIHKLYYVATDYMSRRQVNNVDATYTSIVTPALAVA